LNDIVTNLVNDETNSFRAKKLIANGSESLSYSDIESQLRETYTCPNKSVKNKNKSIKSFVDNWQLFFHGNTHTTNFKFMLNFLNSRSPHFDDYESASKLIGENQTVFKDYYNQKEKRTSEKIDLNQNEEPDDYRYPILQNYYKISLD